MIVGAVVLAAGKSERMGQNKLLMSLNGKTLIDGIMDALTAAGVGKQVIVVGHDPGRMIEALKPKLQNACVVVNEDYEKGMASSFQRGLQELLFADAAFLILGDQPILDPEFLRLMIRAMERNDNALIISPIHRGKKGHPLLFRKDLFHEMLSMKSHQTLRDVVHGCTDRVFEVGAPWWTTFDIDTPEDYAHFVSLMARDA